NANYYLEVKHSIALNELMQDVQFNAILTKLRNDLENPRVKVLDVINQLPENIIREFPATEADMLRQINYRFAPWFVDLMAKTLNQNHVGKLTQTQTTVQSEPMTNKPKTGKYLGWIFNTNKKVETEPTKPVKSAEERLQDTLQLIDSSVFNGLIT